MKILGIETSCDETAASIVENGKKLLSNVVASSLDLHKKYGGVVPEIAARSHIESITPVIEQALYDAFSGQKSQIKKSKSKNIRHSTFDIKTQSDPWDQIDAIAVTNGAGLSGSLLVGVMAARTLAIIKKKPLYAINHVHAHVAANFITSSSPALTTTYDLPPTAPAFPLLALIVSGGHTQLVLFKDHFDYKLLGQTHDDAIGEAFDKVAKMLGLPYPGGPSVAKLAENGDKTKYKFPKAKMANKYDFSFSGLKTAVLRTAQSESGHSRDFPSYRLAGHLSGAQKANLAASFQYSAVEAVIDKTLQAYQQFKPKSVVIAGGVAASQELRKMLSERIPLLIQYTDPKLCTDNGAMVAALGFYTAKAKLPSAGPFSLEIQPSLSM